VHFLKCFSCDSLHEILITIYDFSNPQFFQKFFIIIKNEFYVKNYTQNMQGNAPKFYP